MDDFLSTPDYSGTTTLIAGCVVAVVFSFIYGAGGLSLKNKLKMGLSPAVVQQQYAAGPYNSSLKTGFADKGLLVRGKDNIEILRNASKDLARKQYSNS
jgi:hypothetical protein